MTQRLSHSHAESLANAIIGIPLSQAVLWLFGLPIGEAGAIGGAMFGVRYLRGFLIRRMFNWIGKRSKL